VKLGDFFDGYLGIYIIKKKKISFFKLSLSNWTFYLIKHWMFTSKSEKFGLVKVMTSLGALA
jgi:hypothetical protein